MHISFFKTVGAIIFTAAMAVSLCGKTISAADEAEYMRGEKLLTENKVSEAEPVFLKLKEKNHPLAIYSLGVIAYNKGDFTTAAKYFRMGADLGEVNCQLQLGILYQEGKGVEKNDAESLKLLSIVAERSGNADICFVVAQMYFHGRGTVANLKKAEKFWRLAAAPAKGDPNPDACLVLGVKYLEDAQKNSAESQTLYENAFKFLEYAAMKNKVEAWIQLGGCYYFKNGVAVKDVERARLCYLAAERCTPTAKAEYNLGVIAMEQGDMEQAVKWMTLAAQKNSPDAVRFLDDVKKGLKPRIKPISQIENALHAAFAAQGEFIKKRTGADVQTLLAEIDGKTHDSKEMTMVKQEVSADHRLKGWDFDFTKHNKDLDSMLVYGREGMLQMKTAEYDKMPFDSNLLPSNPTIRAIQYRNEEAMIAALKKSPFVQCDEKRVGEIAQILEMENSDRVVNKFWKLKEDLYFCLQSDFTGAWNMRRYMFFQVKDGKFYLAGSFDFPPGAEEVAVINGCLQGDAASFNNFAVAINNREIYAIDVDDDDIEGLLQIAAKAKNAAAVYNLGVFYFNRDQKDKAEEFFKKAREMGFVPAK